VLTVIQPEIVAGLVVLYLKHGRWEVGQGSVIEGPEYFQHSMGELAAAGR
jgi:hypothetical protein